MYYSFVVDKAHVGHPAMSNDDFLLVQSSNQNKVIHSKLFIHLAPLRLVCNYKTANECALSQAFFFKFLLCLNRASVGLVDGE